MTHTPNVLAVARPGDAVLIPIADRLTYEQAARCIDSLREKFESRGIGVGIIDGSKLVAPVVLRGFGDTGSDAGTPIYDEMVAGR